MAQPEGEICLTGVSYAERLVALTGVLSNRNVPRLGLLDRRYSTTGRRSGMTQAIGPVMLDVEGPQLTSAERELLKRPAVGGVIFFARNFKTIDQLCELVASIRAINPALLLAVDQEGGRVQRFKNGFTLLPAMQCFSATLEQDPDKALRDAENCGWLMAVEVLACGLDFSLAPVLDVDRERCLAIGNRAFSDKADQVVLLAEAFIKGMHNAGMAATGKHFPGHGSVVGDTHVSSPIDERSLEQIVSSDMVPFAALNTLLDAVMPAHVIFSSVDSRPVGFSPVWLQSVLRQQLGFSGVIFSDDLSMQAATAGGDFASRALAAMDAGCDMVLVCNHRQGAIEVLDAFENAGIKGSSKLANMRARASWSWEALAASERWRDARGYFSTLATCVS